MSRYIYNDFKHPEKPYSIEDTKTGSIIYIEDLAWCCCDWFPKIVGWLNEDYIGERRYANLAIELGGTQQGLDSFKIDLYKPSYELRANLIINKSLRIGYDFNERFEYDKNTVKILGSLRENPEHRLAEIVKWLNNQKQEYFRVYNYAEKVNNGRYEI